MKTSLKEGTVYLSISSIIFIISGYIINIWLGRYLGPADYGLYGVIISLVTMINITQNSGLPQAISHYVASNNEFSDPIFKSGFYIQLISTTCASIIFFLVANLLANMLHDTSLAPYLKLSSLIFPFYGIYSFLSGYYNGLHYFKKQAFINIIYSIAKAITIIVFTLFFHLYGAIAGFIISPLISLLSGFYWPKISTKSFPYKKIIFFSLPLIGFAIFSNLLQSIDLYFVKSLLQSNEATGYYTASQNIARIPYFALSALSLVIFPGIAKSTSQNEIEKTKKIITQSLRFALIILIPSSLLISATSGSLLQLLYSTRYIQATIPLSILILGLGGLAFFTTMSAILNGAGESRVSFYISGLGIILVSCFCLLLIPKLGLKGAALSTSLGSIIMVTLTAFFINQRFHVLISAPTIIKISIASGFLYLIARFLPSLPFFLPFFYLILFIFYFAFLVLLREITKEDVQLVKSLLPAKIADRINL